MKVVRDNIDIITVDLDNLQDFVGKPIFTSDRMYENVPAGVVMGLAWTSMGTCCLFGVVKSICIGGGRPSGISV